MQIMIPIGFMYRPGRMQQQQQQRVYGLRLRLPMVSDGLGFVRGSLSLFLPRYVYASAVESVYRDISIDVFDIAPKKFFFWPFNNLAST